MTRTLVPLGQHQQRYPAKIPVILSIAKDLVQTRRCLTMFDMTYVFRSHGEATQNDTLLEICTGLFHFVCNNDRFFI